MEKKERQQEQARAKDKGRRPVLLRSIAVGAVFALAAGYLGYHLSVIQLEQNNEWSALASNQQLANVEIAPERGAIYDANMKAMAVSATVWTVEAAPNVLAGSKIQETGTTPARVAARELARVLELDEEALYEKLKDEESKYAAVKAKIEKPVADEVRALCAQLSLRGIYLRQDSKRYYPFEEMASTILGFTNADGNGIEGIESWYDEELAGTPGRQVTVQNAWGGEIAATGEEGDIFPAKDGYSLVLTVDTEIQQVLEKYLSSAVTQHAAHERGMGIVMDVNTGAILAIAVSPAYDPNEPYEIYDEASLLAVEEMPDGDERVTAQGVARTTQWRNKALADTYEPGSVLKVITAAAALDSGTYTEHSGFFCGSEIQVNDRVFGCALNAAHGNLDVRGALIESCNVSFIQMAQGMGVSTWYDYIKAFGLTEPTGVDLPGEPGPGAISNLVYSEDRMGPVELASCSFGQSNKYTALQMITAVSAAVNGGNLMQPYIVQQVLDADGNVVENIEPYTKRQVISAETSDTLRDILEDLVSGEGSGSNAYVAGYHVGGKSGTSQKLELLPEKEVYISSFLGFAPANDPQIAVLVVLDEPEDPTHGNYFGGRLAGPSVGNIINETLQILGVEPTYDNEEEAGRTTISCPALVESALTDAQVSLNQNGLTPVVIGGGATVTAQYPEAYSQVPSGGQVFLYTDDTIPWEKASVPDVTGKTGQAAIEALKASGLNVLTTGAPLSGGSVVVSAQDHGAGAEVIKGTVITLTLAGGSATE